MSDHLESGLHPDTDSLNAFLEGVLPEHERLRCLAHLAECARCREIVFLAQEPQLAPVKAEPAPGWRRWFAPIPVFSVVAAVCTLAIAVWLYPRRTPVAPPTEVAELARPAQPEPAPQPLTALPPVEIRKKAVPALAPSAPKAEVRVNRDAAPAAPAVVAAPPVSPPAPATQAPAEAFQNLAINQPPAPVTPAVAAPSAAGDGLSAIAGTVTDPAGAAISGATVSLQPLTGASGGNARTDASGKFRVAGLTAGRYDVRIAAPGFAQTSKQIDLQAKDVATLNSELKLGSVSQTVEVRAASPMLSTESAARASAKDARLLNKRPAAITVSNGKIMLSADAAGALFISHNAGKSWKSVKPAWHGKVVGLVSASDGTTFQLTTDAGSVWLSRDGTHWQQAPAK